MPNGEIEKLLKEESERLSRQFEPIQQQLTELQREAAELTKEPEALTYWERFWRAATTIPRTKQQQDRLKQIGAQMSQLQPQLASNAWRQFVLSDPELLTKPFDEIIRKYTVSPEEQLLYSPTEADRQWLSDIYEQISSLMKPPPTLAEVGEALTARPTARPVALSILTVDEIVKALTTPARPTVPFSESELKDVLVEGGMSLTEAEERLSLEEFARDRANAWKQTISTIEALKTGAAQLENINIPWTQWALTAISSPFLIIGEVIQPYQKYWDYPRCYYLTLLEEKVRRAVQKYPTLKEFFQYTPINMTPRAWVTEMEAEYQKNLQTMGSWDAASKAWNDAELNKGLKLLLEVGSDPVTYLGYGIYSKVAKPIPLIGKLVGGLERGYVKLWDVVIFDRIKALGRMVPKGLTARAFYYQQDVLNEGMHIVAEITNRQPQKVLPETAEALYKAGLEAFKLEPGAQGGLYSLGKMAIDAAPSRVITEANILGWARAVDSPIIRTAKDISPTLASAMDDIMDLALRGVKQEAEAADMLLNALGKANTTSKIVQDTAKMIVRNFKETVFREAERLVTARPTDRFGMRIIMRVADAARENYIIAERSAIYLERLRGGMIAQMLNKIDPVIRTVWVDTVERGIIYPFARANLAFGAYGIGNIFEGIFKPIFAGVSPYRPRWLGGSAMQPLDLYAIMTKKLSTIGELATATTRPEINVPRATPLAQQRNWARMLDNFLSGRLEFPEWAGRLAGKKLDLYHWLVESPGAFGTQQRADYMNKMMLNFLADQAPETTKAVIDTVERHLARMPKTGNKLTDSAIADYMKWAALVDPASVKDVFRQIWNTRDVREVEKLLAKLPYIDAELGESVIRATASGDIFANGGKAINNYMANLATAQAAKLLRSPEVVAVKYQNMSRAILGTTPTTYEQLLAMIDNVVQMVDTEQALIRAILKQAEYEGIQLGKQTGLKSKMFQQTWEGISKHIPAIDEATEAAIGHVLRYTREVPPTGVTAEQANKLTNVILAQQKKLSYIREARLKDSQYLATVNFAEIRRRGDAGWAEFHRTREAFYSEAYNKYLAELEGVDTTVRAIADALPTPPRIDASARKLTVNDVCELLGGGVGDDLLRNQFLLELQTLRDKAEFVAIVRGRANLMADTYKTTADALGFTKEKIGAVYDELIGRMGIDAVTAPPLEPVFKQIGELKQGLWKIFENKGLTEAKHSALTRWVDDLADDLSRVPIYNTAEWNTIRQTAHDLAAKEYFKDFADYMHPSILNQTMRSIFPYWTYEAHRWFWIPREFLRHPGLLPTWGRYMDYTDRGYVQLPFQLSINMLRGTIWMGGFTRLTMRDFPEFYDNFPQVAGVVDFLGRYGFYPNVLIMGALSIFGGADPRRTPQMWELLPPWLKTTLGIYFGATQSSVAKALANKIAPYRYRDYYALLIGDAKVSRSPQQYPDIDPLAIWSNIMRGVALTAEEQKFWDACTKEAFRYGALMEQGGVFRLRPQELSDALKDAENLIYEISGITPEQQRSLRAKGLRYNDYIRKYISVNDQRLLNELDAFVIWAGRQLPIMPTLESEQMVLQNEFWREFDALRRQARTVGVFKLDPETGEKKEKIMDGQEDIDALAISSGNMERWRRDSANLASQLRTAFDALRSTRAYRNVPVTIEERIEKWEKEGILPLAFHPSEELMHKYYDIKVERITELDDDGNEITYDDWDTYWALTRAMLEAIKDVDPEVYKQFIDILDYYATPLQKLYRDVSRDYIFSYRVGVRAAVLALFTEDEKKLLREFSVASPSRRAEIRKIVRADGTQLVNQYTTALRNARRNYRMLNPELDAWLRFFGYTDALLTPEAEALYNQYRDAWGMPR